MRHSDVIVLGPAGWISAVPPIAAARAGACGFLDLEYASEEAARAALRTLGQFTTTPFGVKVGPESGRFLAGWLTEQPRLTRILLAGGDHPELPALVELIRSHGREALFEAIDLAEARRGRELGVDALVLKGQESGGRVGGDSAFILLQRWVQSPKRERGVMCALAHASGSDPAVYVQGGIGANTAAACLLAGAAGVVLDAQLLLLRESPLSDDLRQRVAAFDGSETALVGERLGATYRVYSLLGLAVVAELNAEEERIARSPLDQAEKREAWRQTVHRLALAGAERGAWFLGQDVALAAPLAARSGTVASLVDTLVEQTRHNLAAARELRPLAEGAALAKQHGTRYPILQGPMTRVSDTAAFADAVARGGALPFLALALLRQAEAEALLRETRDALGDRPWGVGILGFVPAEIRQEQLAAIKAYKPPFALIAGGRPDQARELEKDGIPTYLHVPSPGLLRMFLKDGARHFIFEGRECGGHVGPRTSFVLWETMTEVLLDHLGKQRPDRQGGRSSDDLAVVFAGGIHDARSAAMVAALAAPLAKRGVAIGVLMGTAYLFTREAVEAGAIMPRFQQEALACRDTVLLQTAPGHAIRCAPTPYCDDFERERRRLIAQGRSHEEIARALEWQNIGRLRLASKGLDRAPEATNGPKLVARPESDQHTRGMYMIGQVATMRDRVLTIAELHDDVSRRGTELLGAPELDLTPAHHDEPARAPCDVAIVGMACFYPGAKNTAEFWQNILDKHNAVTEVPPSHWDWRLYYDPDPRARDKIISKWGGFLKDVPFDPIDYGITPNSLHSIEPLQLFLLEASRLALTDAGLDWKDEGARRSLEPGVLKRSFPRERTAAILGIGGGGSPLAVLYGFRTCLPLLETVPGLDVNPEAVLDKARAVLPEWTEDSFPGILFNVAVGRVANRFNLGGPNYAIDAACGSSLAAVYACVRELETGTSDVAIAMGADTVQTPYAYMAFSKTHALSPNGRCRPFDAAADGIVLSEGVGAVILKRLADAVRDGDRVYAVIKGMGASSDGKDKGLTAPRAEGQLRALRRAYAQAGVSPAAVELIEAHGTGTVVGDQTEARALAQVMEEAGAAPQSCAVGSVKSMIGHTKCAAGIAGLIKAAQALHRRALPPTLVETPNAEGSFEDGPLYLNTEARPWLHDEGPRHAGVSAFGFGGTNFHAVLSEYEGDYFAEQPGLARWPGEVFVWSGERREALRGQVEHCLKALEAGAKPALPDLAASTWRAAALAADRATLAVVAGSLEELKERLVFAEEQLKGEKEEFSDPRGVYFSGRTGNQAGAVAFLFPGQGSQYVNMLAQLALAFPEARRVLDRAQRLLAGRLERPLGRFLYPGPAFSPEKEKAQREALTRSDVAQPAIGACSLAILHLLERLGVEPSFLAGHSYGEFTALCAAGALSEDDLLRLSHRRGEVIRDCTHAMPGGMVALDVEESRAAELLTGIEGVGVANSNSPAQTVVAGTETGLEALLTRCREKGVRGQRLPVACAFHSPLVAKASEPLARAISECDLRAPRKRVFSNVTARPYDADPAAVARTLVEHLTSPVRFREQVEAMYAAGARVFVEVGPQAVLTGLVRQTLGDRPHLACASDQKGRPGVVQLLHLVGQLVTRGVPVRPAALFKGRGVRPFDLAGLSPATGAEKLPATAWVINSVRNRPAGAPEPVLLGQPKTKETAKVSKPAAPAASATPVTPLPEVPRMPALNPATNGDSHHHAPTNGKAALPHAAGADDAAQVMLRFQDLMARFLDTQKAVMTAYLHGSPMPTVPLPALPAAPPPPQARVAGVESAKPRPAPHRAAEDSPLATPAPPPAAEKPKADRAWITARLQELISKRTGYPKEMLGLDIDLEADLGIDSIKRVEILAEMAQALGGDAETGLPAGWRWRSSPPSAPSAASSTTSTPASTRPPQRRSPSPAPTATRRSTSTARSRPRRRTPRRSSGRWSAWWTARC
jgi:acyl transferase domain-containing protein/NAD(P)H-dependent flavin oxidoreductase YrpB (nitropropane dioxygenase family)